MPHGVCAAITRILNERASYSEITDGGPHQMWSAQLIDCFFQAEDGIRDGAVTGVQTCALPISEYERGREHFKIRTSPVFDGLAPAEAAAEHTLGFLFNAERAARLVEFHSRNGENPGLEEVLDVLLRATWKAPHGQDYNAQIAGVVDNVAVYDLMALVANDHASEEVRAISSPALDH